MTPTSSPTSIFAPLSTPAQSIFELSILVLVISAAIFLVVAALLVYAVVKFRKRHSDDGREPAERVKVEAPPPAPATTRREVADLHPGDGDSRAWLPIETYPISAGIRGGLAGGLTMAVLALLYGAATGLGIWYPVNLLSAGFFPGAVAESTAELARFSASSTAIAFTIHLCTSIAVGLLYGAMLPMLPRRPILLGGVLAPLLWSAMLHSSIVIINPVLNERVDWFWFVVTQFGFGIVAGIIVAGRGRVRTFQGAPFAVRAGLEGTQR